MENSYLSEELGFSRLWTEYKKHKKLVIAYDYDNTVFDYHKKGFDFDKVIKLIRRCREKGFYLIVFTRSPVDRYDEIREYLNKNDIPFDLINEDPPFDIKESRKIFFNIFLDDRAGLPSAYRALKEVLDNIENKPKMSLIDEFREWAKEQTSTKEKAQEFLKNVGIHDENGNLSERYGG